MYNDICMLLRKAGLRGTLRGFHYLAQAVLLVLEDSTYLLFLTKRLYPDVADTFHVTPVQVERSMRTAIDVLWNRGDIDALENILGYRLTDKPYDLLWRPGQCDALTTTTAIRNRKGTLRFFP